MPIITKAASFDRRFALQPGEGADAAQAADEYAYAVTLLQTDIRDLTGTGLALTLGAGNNLVCTAIEFLAPSLVCCEIEELMADFGNVFRRLADHPQLRWLCPHN